MPERLPSIQTILGWFVAARNRGWRGIFTPPSGSFRRELAFDRSLHRPVAGACHHVPPHRSRAQSAGDADVDHAADHRAGDMVSAARLGNADLRVDRSLYPGG